MAYVAVGNPIGSCQYRLLGGRRMFVRAGVAGLAAVALIVLYQRMEGPPATLASVAPRALRILAWAQVAVMVIGGAGAIHRALARDYATRMIESYRISPMSSFTVVAGYLLGSTLQILLLWAVGLLLGLGLSRIGGRSPADWLVGNLCLLIGALSIWSMAVFAGLGAVKPGNLTLLLILAGFMAPVLMSALPGLALFLGVYTVASAQRDMLGLLGGRSGIGMALAASLVLMAFWMSAAARRYRKPYLPALGVAGSLVFVGLWLLVFVVGVVWQQELVPGGWSMGEFADMVLAGSLISPLIVGHLPAAAAVRMRRRRIMGAEPWRWSDRCPPGLALALTGLLLCAFAAVFAALEHAGWLDRWRPVEMGDRAWPVIGAALLLGAWTVTGLLKLSQYTIGRSVIASLAVIFLWGLPPLIDYMRVIFIHGGARAGAYSFLAGCSPLVTVSAACVSPAYNVLPGLLIQLGVAAAAHFAGHWAESALVRRRAGMQGPADHASPRT